jgi:hypothetical protein
VSGLMFVVARDQPQIYEYLARALAGTEHVEVMVDRRVRERRREARPAAPAERRRADRRRRPHEPAQFFPLGYAIVRRPVRRRWLRLA